MHYVHGPGRQYGKTSYIVAKFLELGPDFDNRILVVPDMRQKEEIAKIIRAWGVINGREPKEIAGIILRVVTLNSDRDSLHGRFSPMKPPKVYFDNLDAWLRMRLPYGGSDIYATGREGITSEFMP